MDSKTGLASNPNKNSQAPADAWKNASSLTSSTSINSSSSKDLKSSAFESLFDSGYSSTTLSVSGSNLFTSQSSIEFDTEFRDKFSIGCEAEKAKLEETDVSFDSGLSIDLLNYNNPSKPKYKREHDVKKLDPSNCLSIDISNPLVLQNAYQPDEDGDTLLHLAITQYWVDLVITLIRTVPHPDYLDITNDLSQTPLHLAALTKQSKIVRCLVVAGSTLDLQNRYGNTALHIACENGDLETVESLLSPVTQKEIRESSLMYSTESQSRGNSLFHIRNNEGETCLHLAVKCGDKRLLERLVDAGADINSQEGKCGKTALHWSVENRQVDLVQYLLKRCKANVNATSYTGQTPLHSALSALSTHPHNRQLRVLVHLLKECGGEPRSLPLDTDSESCDDDSDDEVITFGFYWGFPH
ncbi:NF-kappa-B inhibitor cactus-like protein [Dinothrombium tinctorium]|uniref:NF-kappa-B inhibitor cactus-like protein n=1 Tax=Dinothrombium tinctorium TaxID=1965070 RepID=A0A3S5WGZ9_9ACAR|nr:NF-kappa-B inhibitor cactus-like protein [Dinothrombium tinctorium]